MFLVKVRGMVLLNNGFFKLDCWSGNGDSYIGLVYMML